MNRKGRGGRRGHERDGVIRWARDCGTSSSSTLSPWQLVITAPVIFQTELSPLFSIPATISRSSIEMTKAPCKSSSISRIMAKLLLFSLFFFFDREYTGSVAVIAPRETMERYFSFFFLFVLSWLIGTNNATALSPIIADDVDNSVANE